MRFYDVYGIAICKTKNELWLRWGKGKGGFVIKSPRANLTFSERENKKKPNIKLGGYRAFRLFKYKI